MSDAPTAPHRTYVFAGGGTGGHIYPALAIAERLRELSPGTRCVFFCSPRPIDSRILTEEAAEFRVMPAQPFGLHPARALRFLGSWAASVREAEAALRELACGGPVEVVAMGGFVAAPVVRAARREGIAVSLVNLDAVPGKANRLIARGADRVFDAAASKAWTRAIPVRPIVRRSAVASESKESCRAALGLAPDRPTLFITGGSQGARTINDLMALLLETEREMLAGWQVYHQTGPDADAAMQAAYDRAGVPAKAVVSCRIMSRAWGAADLTIARCGAGAVGEVWASAVPSVFLPYPFHRDEHQRRNAQPLADAGGAVIVKDWVDARRTLPALREVLGPLLRSVEARAAMRSSLAGLGPADGAITVAGALLGMHK